MGTYVRFIAKKGMEEEINRIYADSVYGGDKDAFIVYSDKVIEQN